jgi:hypothetical protein
MAYKQKGCTPITAKLQKTTKGGVVQPALNVGKVSPAKQGGKSAADARKVTNAKGQELAAKKEAAEKALVLQKAKDLASKEFVPNQRGRKVKNPKYQAPSTQPVNETSKGDTRTGTKKGTETKKGTYAYAKASQPELDNIISKRNKATKGTAEYNRHQNQINKAYGVGPTNRSATEKTISTIKPKVTIDTKTPTPSTDLRTLEPKAPKITNEKAAKKSARNTAKAQEVRQKGIDALASGNSGKALKLKRRETRINKRAEKQAEKAIAPAKQTAKQQQQKRRILKG